MSTAQHGGLIREVLQQFDLLSHLACKRRVQDVVGQYGKGIIAAVGPEHGRHGLDARTPGDDLAEATYDFASGVYHHG